MDRQTNQGCLAGASPVSRFPEGRQNDRQMKRSEVKGRRRRIPSVRYSPIESLQQDDEGKLWKCSAEEEGRSSQLKAHNVFHLEGQRRFH